MPTIVGIAGSLRRSSYNVALLRAAVELAPAGLTIEVASIREFPLYDGDVEKAWGRFQRVLSDYGALLGMWPELWRHAREHALVPSLKATTSSLGC